jgi:L-alanine-DL-glutamate epimerase-like enolase superfamily enzyme
MYEAVADLPLTVESVELERRSRDTPQFERVSTVVALRGDGETGRGEDVTYETAHHDDLLDADPDLTGALAGDWTFDAFAARLDQTDLWPAGLPDRLDFVDYRRWGFEAAALDLALRQAGETLAERLDRALDPVRFVASSRLPDGDTERVETLLDRYPEAELKLDVTDDWTDHTFDYLGATDAVRVLDLKGQYEGTEVDNAPDPDTYERVFEAFPDAVVEDPGLTDETRPIVDAHADQISWDAIIHGLGDVHALPFQPDWLNIKPSRFGTLESLLETIAWAHEHDVALYGGGQFELDVGRGQLHELASLFYADAPNDVAPRAYNEAELPEDPPRSPISVPEDHAGFGF